MAEKRLAALEAQLKDSKHGVAYADGTEKVIQLNRPAENNLMGQIEFLTSMLYSQLGVITSYSIHYTKLYDFKVPDESACDS